MRLHPTLAQVRSFTPLPTPPAVLLTGGAAATPEAPAIVPIHGDITSQNREHLRARVRDQFEQGHPVVLDLSGCGHIDSSGLGVLVSLTREGERQGLALTLRGVDEELRTLLELTKIDTVLRVEAPAP